MAQDAACNECLGYHGVVCTGDSLLAISGGHVTTTVPRDEIRRLALRHGFQSTHPIVCALVGASLATAGLLAGSWAGRMSAETLCLATALWTLLAASKRGYYLDVHTRSGRRRLVFTGRVSRRRLAALVTSIESYWGMPVSNCLSSRYNSARPAASCRQ